MTASDLAILLDETVRREIEHALPFDPAQVALSAPRYGAQIATQVKYLQRARTKLPSYYRARCILPPLAFEQASSEETAALKSFEGNICIDLTCGLGVDSLYLSRRFTRVISLERDPLIAEVARINFARLGADNIEVLTLSAEEFLQNPPAYIHDFSQADLIYVDPARRGAQGEKLFRLETCSPNVLALLPQIEVWARRLVIKASPLFDVEETFRLFGPNTIVETVSLHGECKEVLILSENDPDQRPVSGLIRTTAVGQGTLEFVREPMGPEGKARYQLQGHSLLDNPSDTQKPLRNDPSDDLLTLAPRYLLIPDVSLYHAHLVGSYAQALGIQCTSPTGYCFAHHIPTGFFGKGYPIRQILPYRPKILKSHFKTEGIERCNLLKKDFPFTAAQIASALGIREGGNRYAAFTSLGHHRYAILLDHD